MIHEILLTGRDNAKRGHVICKELGITRSELRVALARERFSGYPICSNSKGNPGYYLAADQEEMKCFCDSLRHRAGEIHRTRRACLKAIDKLPAAKEVRTQ